MPDHDGSPSESHPRPPAGPRLPTGRERAARDRPLLLSGLEVHRAGNHVTCRVELRCDGHAYRGEDREMDTRSGRARAAARASLIAAELALGDVSFGLEGVVLLNLFGRAHAVVSVEASSGRRHASLAGIVRLDRSVEDAACLAALSAIERWG